MRKITVFLLPPSMIFIKDKFCLFQANSVQFIYSPTISMDAVRCIFIWGLLTLLILTSSFLCFFDIVIFIFYNQLCVYGKVSWFTQYNNLIDRTMPSSYIPQNPKSPYINYRHISVSHNLVQTEVCTIHYIYDMMWNRQMILFSLTKFYNKEPQIHILSF